jgi:hypothetical protein
MDLMGWRSDGGVNGKRWWFIHRERYWKYAFMREISYSVGLYLLCSSCSSSYPTPSFMFLRFLMKFLRFLILHQDHVLEIAKVLLYPTVDNDPQYQGHQQNHENHYRQAGPVRHVQHWSDVSPSIFTVRNKLAQHIETYSHHDKKTDCSDNSYQNWFSICFIIFKENFPTEEFVYWNLNIEYFVAYLALVRLQLLI